MHANDYLIFIQKQAYYIHETVQTVHAVCKLFAQCKFNKQHLPFPLISQLAELFVQIYVSVDNHYHSS